MPEPVARPRTPVRLGVRVARAAVVGATLTAVLVACSSSTTATGPSTTTSVAAPAGSSRSGTGGDPGTTTGTGSASVGGGSTDIPERFRGAATEMYLQDENWLCRPDLPTDACREAQLDATRVHPDGSTSPEPFTPATDPKIDCFYVYPTINLTGGATNDDAMAADPAAEIGVTRGQFARFAEVCRPFAPLYRQMSLPGYGSPDRETYLAKAYGDVHDAFRTYMDRWNDGRPVVLIGHSQGSGHLSQLLADEFDHDPDMQARLMSALLIGGRTDVPEGKDVGGTFDELRLCTQPGQLHCVVAYNSVAADSTAADLASWGGPRDGGVVNACTDPSHLAGTDGRLLTYNGATGWVTGTGVAVTTPQVALDGALTSSCVTRDGGTALQIEAAPGGTVQGDIAPLVKNFPGWGLHLNEVGLTQGSLIAFLRSQIAALG